MCLFSGHVQHVGSTKIFGASLVSGAQALAYEMEASFDDEVAMVLPIPVPRGSTDDAVRFVDLSSYPTFFADLERGFPMAPIPQYATLSRGGAPAAAPPLVVHDVGDFEASFVPTPADFERLDERFRLPETAFARLPQYADWGFAVFKLRTGRGLRQFHPMAFVFPRRDAGQLFFPTTHLHDGEVHSHAQFDHELYGQGDDALAMAGWERSKGPSSAFMKPCAIVDERAHVFRQRLWGSRANEDTVVDARQLQAAARELEAQQRALEALVVANDFTRVEFAYVGRNEPGGDSWMSRIPEVARRAAHAVVTAIDDGRRTAWGVAEYASTDAIIHRYNLEAAPLLPVKLVVSVKLRGAYRAGLSNEIHYALRAVLEASLAAG